MISLNPLGNIIWEDRYGLKDENGNLIEKNIEDTFRRNAKAMASKEKDPQHWERVFADLLISGHFCPAGRILAHSGTHYSQLLNCFVLPFRNDSLEEIMHTASDMAIVQKFGGGCIGGESIILTNKGPRPLKLLVEQADKAIQVLSYNPQTNETEFCNVLDWHTTPMPGERVYQIEFQKRNGIAASMHASDWHPFFVLDGEKIIQVRADKLEPGMVIVGVDKKSKKVNAKFNQTVIISTPTNSPETLYDLTVDKNQTYIASDPSTDAYVVVHNTGFNYSKLRPSGSHIKGVNGRSCGIIGFLSMMSTVSEVIEQGGCLTKDTLINTEKGLFYLNEIVTAVGDDQGWYDHDIKIKT
jgi:ribonucleotide reductase alpha subunit